MHVRTHLRVQDLLELYDKLHKTKMIGVEYTANVVIDLREGLSAFRQGVQKGWKIGEVCGTVMPTEPGSESFIHGHFSKIKSKDTDIIIKFDLPDGSSKTLTFESYVTRDDLKQVLQGSTLATMLGAKRGSEEDLDELFNTLDADHDNAIEKLEWKDFVTDRMKACKCTRTCARSTPHHIAPSRTAAHHTAPHHTSPHRTVHRSRNTHAGPRRPV